MKRMKWLAVLLGAYVGIVGAFESFVMIMGQRQAADGVRAGESWLIVTTTESGRSSDTVVGGVASAGHLYVAANHWPRGWYHRAIANPDVEVTQAGQKAPYRAVPVAGEEREQIARDYTLPWLVRFLTGFPPREFLRLDPRAP